jgi:hypothetical protein
LSIFSFRFPALAHFLHGPDICLPGNAFSLFLITPQTGHVLFVWRPR